MVPIPSLVTAIPEAEFPLTRTKEMQNGWMPAVGILASWSESQQQWHCGIPPPEISLGNFESPFAWFFCARFPWHPRFFCFVARFIMAIFFPDCTRFLPDFPKAMAQQSLTPRQADKGLEYSQFISIHPSGQEMVEPCRTIFLMASV